MPPNKSKQRDDVIQVEQKTSAPKNLVQKTSLEDNTAAAAAAAVPSPHPDVPAASNASAVTSSLSQILSELEISIGEIGEGSAGGLLQKPTKESLVCTFMSSWYADGPQKYQQELRSGASADDALASLKRQIAASIVASNLLQAD